MKSFIVLLLVFLSIVSLGQEPVSYVSPKKDTLYLINDHCGVMIKKSWHDSICFKPIFVFVSREKLYKLRATKNLSISNK